MIIKMSDMHLGKVLGGNMSQVLNKIANLEAEDILDKVSDEYITVDIFAIAKELGIKVYMVDFSELESSIGCKKDSILGAVADNDDSDFLAILLKKDLGNDEYYADKTQKDKNTILRRRQRFTLAHEIAHACLHLPKETGKYKVDFRTELNSFFEESSQSRSEYEANVFAGKLLIPKKHVLTVCSKLVYNSLNALCDIFDVSHSVMKARLQYIGIDFIDDSDEDTTELLEDFNG